MRIAIFGAGGAGGYFGAHLARAGEDIVFIARGEHLRAIRSHGLQVELPGDDIVVQAPATDDPTDVGTVDIVLVGVKAWQVADAARAMRPMIGTQTLVVPLQNGVEAAAQLAAVLGAHHVLGGLCGTISWVKAPGHICSLGETHFIRFGELDHSECKRGEGLRQAFERAGVNVAVPPNIEITLWEKFVFGVPFGGVGAVLGESIGVVRSLPHSRRMLEEGMHEIVMVARARGIALADGIVERSMILIDSLDASSTTSLQRDISAGRPSELDAWTGAVVRLGREAGVPTPLHEHIYNSLLTRELLSRGEDVGTNTMTTR